MSTRQLGFLVDCLNCGILWRRITENSNPTGTVPLEIIQTLCPRCGSNAWEIDEDGRKRRLTNE